MTNIKLNSASDRTNQRKHGYWAGVARDGNKMGFWFVLPTVLLLLFISFSTSHATIFVSHLVDAT